MVIIRKAKLRDVPEKTALGQNQVGRVVQWLRHTTDALPSSHRFSGNGFWLRNLLQSGVFGACSKLVEWSGY